MLRLSEEELKQKLSQTQVDDGIEDPINEEEEYQKGLVKVNKLGYPFLILFCSYGSSQNLISSIFKSLNFTNLGLISLFMVYITFALASLIAKGIVEGRSFRLVFTLSNLGYSAYISSGAWVFLCQGSEQTGICSIEVIYGIVIVSAALCGLCASTLWVRQVFSGKLAGSFINFINLSFIQIIQCFQKVAQGVYIDQVCSTCPGKRGILFGTFIGFISASNVLGSVFAMTLLNVFGNTTYFVLNSLLSLLSAYLMSRVPELHQRGSYQCTDSVSLRERVSEVFSLFKDERIKRLLPFYFLCGIVVAFYSSFLQVLVKKSLSPEEIPLSTQYLSYVVIILGVAGIFGGYISGKLADKLNPYLLVIGSTMICSFGLFTSMMGLQLCSYAFCFLIAAFWGCCDSFNQSLIIIIGSRDFQGRAEIFAFLKFVTATACSFAFVVSILLDPYEPFYFLSFILIIQIASTISAAPLLSRLSS